MMKAVYKVSMIRLKLHDFILFAHLWKERPRGDVIKFQEERERKRYYHFFKVADKTDFQSALIAQYFFFIIV